MATHHAVTAEQWEGFWSAHPDGLHPSTRTLFEELVNEAGADLDWAEKMHGQIVAALSDLRVSRALREAD
jgi:fido (protein-threonine AMPylation protein)